MARGKTVINCEKGRKLAITVDDYRSGNNNNNGDGSREMRAQTVTSFVYDFVRRVKEPGGAGGRRGGTPLSVTSRQRHVAQGFYCLFKIHRQRERERR